MAPNLSNRGGSRRLQHIKDALTKVLPHIPRGYQPVEIETVAGP